MLINNTFLKHIAFNVLIKRTVMITTVTEAILIKEVLV